MAALFTKLLNTLNQPRQGPLDAVNMERVSAMLLVEIARADHEIDAAEGQQIARALKKSSALSADDIDALVAEAMLEADASLSLHEHVSVVNQCFEKQEKIALVEQMWKVALADGNIDRYEEYTIRKLCDLIHVKHRDFMQAKHRVTGEAGE